MPEDTRAISVRALIRQLLDMDMDGTVRIDNINRLETGDDESEDAAMFPIVSAAEIDDSDCVLYFLGPVALIDEAEEA